jgi:dihydropteroate synthase
MGVVNVTPDSFSDGGQFLTPDKAVAHAMRLEQEGADIIDFGGQSTRPGSDPVSQTEEMDRVLPVIERAVRDLNIPISIDTTRASVAREALSLGAHIVNDISGLKYDPRVANVTAEFGAGIILMHIRKTPKTMQDDTKYQNLFHEICRYLEDGIQVALNAGIPSNNIAVDPGIGFGKSTDDSYRLIDNLSTFRDLDCPIVIGPSRKSFIGIVLNLPAERRIWGTAAAVACSVIHGADIVRVHDVAEMKQVAIICDTILKSRNGGINIA